MKEDRANSHQLNQSKVFPETRETDKNSKFPHGIKLKHYDNRFVITDNMTGADAESLYMK